MTLRQCSGMTEKYKNHKENTHNVNFRDVLSSSELKSVETVESMIKSMLELGNEYGEIKNVLEPIFKNKKEVIE